MTLGTWIPLHDGRSLADRIGVLDKLLIMFDFVPGDRSPPPAPKHATAASGRPRPPRQSAAAAARRQPVVRPPVQEEYDAASIGQFQDDETADNITIVSESLMDDDPYGNSQFSNSRKRKRPGDQMSVHDQQHQIWADALLDYFMLLESEDRFPAPPEPPPGVNLDRPIDEKGHSALHWAAAMGDIDVVRDLIKRGARLDCLSNNLETPLMRAVMFTNNFDKQSMAKLVRILAPTVFRTDWFGSTVFHHIAATTSSKNKYQSARYYLDSVINVLSETWIPDEITRLLNMQDKNGDTAIHIAARHGARKCVRSLLGRNVSVDLANNSGESADDLIRDLNARRRTHHQSGRREVSSSPFAPDASRLDGDLDVSMFGAGLATSGPVSLGAPQYRSQTATALSSRITPSFMDSLRALSTAYETEFSTKETEALEAERVSRKRGLEVDALKKQVGELGPLEAQVDEPVAMDMDVREEAELDALVREAEALLEAESREELGRMMPADGMASANGNGNGQYNLFASGTNGIGLGGGSDTPALATKLLAAQRERQRLVRDTVRSMSVAGLGERQAEYKRLICAALGVKTQEVEGMLDEILRELEEEREMRRGDEAVEA